MNGAVESANKNLIKILKKMAGTHKDWHDKLPYALWVYKTSVRTSTRATLYSLVYGMEAVLPIEVEIPSLRILREAELEEAEWVEDRCIQLNLINEHRLQAMHHAQCYQKRLARAYQKKVRPRSFRPGYMVLRAIHLPDGRGKFWPNWRGPFLIKRVFSSGVVVLENMDQVEQSEPVNTCYLKKYYQ